LLADCSVLYILPTAHEFHQILLKACAFKGTVSSDIWESLKINEYFLVSLWWFSIFTSWFIRYLKTDTLLAAVQMLDNSTDFFKSDFIISMPAYWTVAISILQGFSEPQISCVAGYRKPLQIAFGGYY
jgi:hypothetical protein